MDIMSYFESDKRRRKLKDLGQFTPEDGHSDHMKLIYEYITNTDLKGYTSITINPKPEYVRALSDYDIALKMEKHLRRFIDLTKRYMIRSTDTTMEILDTRINPRMILIGEHGSQGMCKLHYHGIISGLPNDLLSHYLQLVRRYIGNTNLSCIRNEPKYIEYMFKSYKLPESEQEIWGDHSCIKINVDIRM